MPAVRYSVEIVSESRGSGMHLVLVVAPQWTRWLISLGYRTLRLTGDRRFGVWLVSYAYALHDRHARKFRLPATPRVVDEFRRWSRGR